MYHPLIKWEGQTDRQTWSRRRRRLHIYNCSSQHSPVAESDYGLLCALFVVKGRGCKTTPLNLLSHVIKWLKTRENAVVWDGRALLFRFSPNGRGFPNGFTIKTFHEAPIWFCLANRLFHFSKTPLSSLKDLATRNKNCSYLNYWWDPLIYSTNLSIYKKYYFRLILHFVMLYRCHFYFMYTFFYLAPSEVNKLNT